MNTESIRVLVVDDEPAIRRGICVSLRATGYETEEARSGEEALDRFREQAARLVLLDINMPGMGGIETCRRIRAADPSAGIVMITVRDTEEDAVLALEGGADDYITKPFRMRELMARLRAICRRAGMGGVPEAPVLRAGDLELDPEHRAFRKAGEQIHLSPIEFSLLQYLMQNPGLPIHHSKLLRTIWGPEYGNELEYLRTYIRLLRRKVEVNPSRPEYIVTEPWLGYRFCVPPAHRNAGSYRTDAEELQTRNAARDPYPVEKVIGPNKASY
jgi:two-component system KDP operon response regulator KdpE